MISEEAEEHTGLLPVSDSISLAVGGRHYISRHRFPLRIPTPVGPTPQLMVSRFYWDLESPVVVDFFGDLTWGETELANKIHYFKQRGFRYAMVKDEYDGEGVETAMLAYQTDGEQVLAVQDAAKPLIGPRRRRSISKEN